MIIKNYIFNNGIFRQNIPNVPIECSKNMNGILRDIWAVKINQTCGTYAQLPNMYLNLMK